MKGHIQQRGKNSWRLKFDAGRDEKTGERKIQYHTFRGTKRQAQVKLAELIASVSQAKYIEPNKITVGDFVSDRVDQWEARGDISARTAQRYRQLVRHQIVPYIGTMLLQKLRPLDVEHWHATLRTSGKMRGKGNLSSRTIGHAHKILGKALSDAAENELVHRNVARLKRPKATDSNCNNMVIVRDVPALLEKLQGAPLRLPAMLGLLCGLRLGEVLALRWSHIDGKVIHVREAIEQTKAHGIRFKPTKSRAGRRSITMPDEVIEALQAYRREQLELRLQLGLGRLSDATLLFWDELDDRPRSIYTVSRAWGDFAARIGMPDLTFHGLRHSHASQLIDAGVDIVTISKRLGHAKPDITLRVYAHLVKEDDSKAAAAINAALQG
jgi:site-specific recombinase XerD